MKLILIKRVRVKTVSTYNLKWHRGKVQSLIDGQSDLPHSFLAQQWRASKDLNFAAPTGEAGGMGSFWFHAQPTTKSFIILQQEYKLSSYPRPGSDQHTTCAEDVFLGKWCIRGEAR